jgi:crossover junction endodeoxyribonuclease RuvC
MRVLGIDPGTLVTGYGVVDAAGSSMVHVASGVIAPPPGPIAERLAAVFQALEGVIAAYAPAEVAVEDLFHARNARSALLLGHARGVALVAGARAGLPVYAYAPQLVKKAVVGHGRADKHQVQRMVRALLGLPADPAEDAADALAVAICHCQRIGSPLREILAAAPRER